MMIRLRMVLPLLLQPPLLLMLLLRQLTVSGRECLRDSSTDSASILMFQLTGVTSFRILVPAAAQLQDVVQQR
jgi:hypothetical protein